jgi:hypothetical protein
MNSGLKDVVCYDLRYVLITILLIAGFLPLSCLFMISLGGYFPVAQPFIVIIFFSYVLITYLFACNFGALEIKVVRTGPSAQIVDHCVATDGMLSPQDVPVADISAVRVAQEPFTSIFGPRLFLENAKYAKFPRGQMSPDVIKVLATLRPDLFVSSDVRSLYSAAAIRRRVRLRWFIAGVAMFVFAASYFSSVAVLEWGLWL